MKGEVEYGMYRAHKNRTANLRSAWALAETQDPRG